MSTSVLYHAFGVRGYEHRRTDYSGGTVIFRVQQPREQLRCVECGSAHVHLKTHVDRMLRLVPIGGKPAWLHVPIPRVACQNCASVRQVELTCAEPRVSYTRAFARYALELLDYMTILDVALHLQVSWDVIRGIQKQHLQRKFGKPKLKQLRRIAIDEISIGRGHRYLTVVQDLERGAVVFVGDGKGADALRPFWNRLRHSGAKVRAVATDMSPAYIAAVRENLPKATLVFDHFHVIKLFNDKLSDLRRELHREAKEKLHKDVLKGTRWLLLKNPENLDAEKNESARLEEALQLNRSLAIAYYLKEDLRQLWNQGSRAAAAKFLDGWIRRADASGVKILKAFARTLASHRSGLLDWYKHPISTGPLEATNNKIQLLKRQAFGYRDFEFFKLKIYALHLSRYALVG